MARREGYQFDYPEKGWSTGKMRKHRERPISDPMGDKPMFVPYSRDQQLRSEVEKGTQYAKMDRLQRMLPGEGGQTAELDRAAGMAGSVAARGGPTGTMQVPAAVVPTQKYAADAIAQHKDFIQENINEVAQGNMTPDIFKRMLKQLGWEGDSKTGKFLDPNGTEHRIEAEAR